MPAFALGVPAILCFFAVGAAAVVVAAGVAAPSVAVTVYFSSCGCTVSIDEFKSDTPRKNQRKAFQQHRWGGKLTIVAQKKRIIR